MMWSSFGNTKEGLMELYLLKLSLYSHVPILGLPGSSVGKESACSAGDAGRCGLDPWVGKIPGGGKGNPLQYSFLKNPMGRGALWAIIHRIANSQTGLK